MSSVDARLRGTGMGEGGVQGCVVAIVKLICNLYFTIYNLLF